VQQDVGQRKLPQLATQAATPTVQTSPTATVR
jgi:hypothetical protein